MIFIFLIGTKCFDKLCLELPEKIPFQLLKEEMLQAQGRLDSNRPSGTKANQRHGQIPDSLFREQHLIRCTNQMEMHLSSLISCSWQTHFPPSAVYDVKVLSVKRNLSNLKLLVVKNRIHILGVLWSIKNWFKTVMWALITLQVGTFHVDQINGMSFWK